MRVIVPTNNKGGVGKTKISILLSEYFSVVQKKRVLGIDFDPQCNFSRRFIKMQIDPAAQHGYMPPLHPQFNPNDEEDEDWAGRSSIADIFHGRAVIPYPTYIENFDIAPAHADQLLLAETQTRSEIIEKVHYQLDKFLSGDDVKSEYDIVIVDTAPSKGPLTVSAIKAATHIIIPCVMETQPVQGIYGMIQVWMEETFKRQQNKPLELIGILPNMFKQCNLHNDIFESLKEQPFLANHLIPHKLGNRVAFAEVDVEEAMPRSIFDLPENNPARIEAINFCDYVNKKVMEYETKKEI